MWKLLEFWELVLDILFCMVKSGNVILNLIISILLPLNVFVKRKHWDLKIYEHVFEAANPSLSENQSWTHVTLFLVHYLEWREMADLRLQHRHMSRYYISQVPQSGRGTCTCTCVRTCGVPPPLTSSWRWRTPSSHKAEDKSWVVPHQSEQRHLLAFTWHGVVRGRSILTRKCGLLRQSHLDLLLDAPRSGHLVRDGAPVPELDVRRQPVGGDRGVGL